MAGVAQLWFSEDELAELVAALHFTADHVVTVKGEGFYTAQAKIERAAEGTACADPHPRY
jgi:hypothetical protein